jgi:hypothetical protein
MQIEAPQSSIEERKKYAGKHAAIVDNRIVAYRDTTQEVFQKAKKLFPERTTEEMGLMCKMEDTSIGGIL